MTCALEEVSLLHFLYLVRSAGGIQRLASIKGGYQQDHVVGGAQTMADIIAADLGPALCLSSPVGRIDTDDNGATVQADQVAVRAHRVVVALPPRLAADVVSTPALPPDRAELLTRMPAGSMRRTLLVHAMPFWRQDVDFERSPPPPGSLVESTLDVEPAAGGYGLLGCFSFGPMADRLGAMDEDQRRQDVLAEMVTRFGPAAADPIDAIEHYWADEVWSRGRFLAHMAPGVMTRLGHVLREPSGPVHWAGTETATTFHGTIDGAIQSGYRRRRRSSPSTDLRCPRRSPRPPAGGAV